jgi:hypothetical protein
MRLSPHGVPKTLVIGTSSNHPVFRCHKPRSKPLGLLNVFGPALRTGHQHLSMEAS